jgi:hypothetical protein
MGIEPTPRTATARGNGFEDREDHQAPCASLIAFSAYLKIGLVPLRYHSSFTPYLV